MALGCFSDIEIILYCTENGTDLDVHFNECKSFLNFVTFIAYKLIHSKGTKLERYSCCFSVFSFFIGINSRGRLG